MQRSGEQSATRRTSIYVEIIVCVALALFTFSCRSLPLNQAAGDEPAPASSIVIIIHGDGNYLFHDTAGNARRADESALARAMEVGGGNVEAEVFIFHERRRRNTLLVFPRRDGTLYYYRHGQLLARETYRRGEGASRFEREVGLYHRFRTRQQTQPVRMLLYFGHEIPERGGRGYDLSYPERAFTIDDLAAGLNEMTPDSSKFDLVVLSTCFNGTPHSISAISPFARTIVASPDNLHLSYFDLHPLKTIGGDVAAFADDFARQSFDRLSEDMQTSVTVAVYDVERVQPYLTAVAPAYDQALAGQPAGHIDCADDSRYVLPGIGEGVSILYQPPRFGRMKEKREHSGWQCWDMSRAGSP